MKHSRQVRIWLLPVILFLAGCGPSGNSGQKFPVPATDWGHWRLGHRAEPEFLEKNKLTVTFGPGAPNFESATRLEFDSLLNEARLFNRQYNDNGYIVLRYMTSSLGGTTATNNDKPEKQQLNLIRFYNESWDDYADYIGPKPPASETPDTWITVHPDGSFPHYRYAPYGRQTTGRFETWGCPNNPYYTRLMEGRIRAQAEAGINGVYVDWTQIAGNTCYCKYCEQAFRQNLEKTLPAKVAEKKYGVHDFSQLKPPASSTDAFWMEWVDFRGTALARFHQTLKEAARKVNPHFLISGNVYGGFGFGPIAVDAAGDMEKLGRVHDFLYSEIQEYLDYAPHKDDLGNKISNSATLKFLSAASGGKPVIVYATEITPPIFPDPTDKCLGAMAQINIAESVANQAVFREKRETPVEAGRMYNILYANESSLIGSGLYSNVAVLVSVKQYIAGRQSYAFSTSRVLADKGLAHVMVTESAIEEKGLSGFDLVIVPGLPLLAPATADALTRFVARGGNLIVLGETATQDAFNLPLEKPMLAKIFGGNSYPETTRLSQYKKGLAVYIPLQVPPDGFFAMPEHTEESTTFGADMTGQFADVPQGFVRGRMNGRLHEELEKIASAVEVLLPGKTTAIQSDNPFVEITAMHNAKTGKVLVHMVNYDVTIAGDVNQAENVNIRLVLPEGATPTSLKLGSIGEAMHEIEYVQAMVDNRQAIYFNVDHLDIYGLAVLDLK